MANLHTIHCLELLLLEENGEAYSVTALGKHWHVTRRTVFRDKATVRKAKDAFKLRKNGTAGTNGKAKGRQRNTDQR